jgi:hypothetical protein
MLSMQLVSLCHSLSPGRRTTYVELREMIVSDVHAIPEEVDRPEQSSESTLRGGSNESVAGSLKVG